MDTTRSAVVVGAVGVLAFIVGSAFRNQYPWGPAVLIVLGGLTALYGVAWVSIRYGWSGG